MACLPSWLRTKYEADLARVQSQITSASEALDSALENAEVEEYSFNSGEGQQRTKRRSIKELQQTLESLEAQEARLLRKLYGTSLVNMNLRRKN
jgi:vacuolar-type H+-ATPase subunit I/STV1